MMRITEDLTKEQYGGSMSIEVEYKSADDVTKSHEIVHIKTSSAHIEIMGANMWERFLLEIVRLLYGRCASCRHLQHFIPTHHNPRHAYCSREDLAIENPQSRIQNGYDCDSFAPKSGIN